LLCSPPLRILQACPSCASHFTKDMLRLTGDALVEWDKRCLSESNLLESLDPSHQVDRDGDLAVCVVCQMLLRCAPCSLCDVPGVCAPLCGVTGGCGHRGLLAGCTTVRLLIIRCVQNRGHWVQGRPRMLLHLLHDDLEGGCPEVSVMP
jgi:hypothetical protein